MNFLYSSISFTLLLCVLLIVCGWIRLRAKKAWASPEVMVFLILCAGFDCLMYFEVQAHFEFQGYSLFVIGFQSVLLAHFVLLIQKTLAHIGGRLNNRFIRSSIFLSVCIVTVVSHLVVSNLMDVEHPHVYTLALSGLISFASFIVLMSLTNDGNSRLVFRTFAFLTALSVSFGISTYYHSDANSLAVLNALFISMLVATIVWNRTVTQEERARIEEFDLTRRQKEVAHLMLSGLNYGQIAKKLNIAESTASKHGSDIFSKTDCKDKYSFIAKFQESYLEILDDSKPT